MSARMNGFLVVDGAKLASGYRGVDRYPWETIDAHYYEKLLPPDMREVYELLRAPSRRGMWWPTAETVSLADRLLDYSRRFSPDDALVGVESPYLASALGRTTLDMPGWTLIGFDVVAVGEWSLLEVLSELDASLLSDVAFSLNPSGLLHDRKDLGLVARVYEALARAGVVEPIASPDPRLPLEAVAIYER